MIEYTQYQQTQIIQAASIIGGIGIGALIVLIQCCVRLPLRDIHKKIKIQINSSEIKIKSYKTICLRLDNYPFVYSSLVYGKHQEWT